MSATDALLTQSIFEPDGVGNSVTQNSVIEDHPCLLCPRAAREQAKPFCEFAQPVDVIFRIVGAWSSMEAPIAQSGPASRLPCQFRALGWVSGDTSNLKASEQGVDRRREPARMTGLQDDTAPMQSAQLDEEILCDT